MLTPSLRSVRVVAGAAVAVALAASAVAAPQVKYDQVFRINERTGKTQAVVCTVQSDGLDRVQVLRRDGRDLSIDPLEIVEIVWGDVPASFSDGTTYASRSDWESAVASFQEAAGDGDAREPVKAIARLHSLEALLAWGVADAARYADAIAEADRFLSDHSASRHVPTVRAHKARAAWLGGDPVAARDGYRALFETGKDGADGYSPLETARAALEGARAALAADDKPGAEDLFQRARDAFSSIESEDAATSAHAAAGAEVAALGPAYVKLASGKAGSVRSTFESAARDNQTSAGVAAARLGLGHALLETDEPRKAQLEFAWVAGLDHTDDDRRAEALVGLAKAAQAAAGDGADAAAYKATLARVVAQYGSTPAAREAAQLLQSM
ncbi:MAG: hypothetical protein AAGA20_10770 [Planctomycetota bacterium]